MSAEEALAYGLIDEIVQPNDEKIRQLSLPPPSQSPELFNEIPKSAIDYEFGKLVSIRIHSAPCTSPPHNYRFNLCFGRFILPPKTARRLLKRYNFPFTFRLSRAERAETPLRQAPVRRQLPQINTVQNIWANLPVATKRL